MSSVSSKADYVADVLVIGCGKSGLPAGVSAVENGAKVLILEEQDAPTGSVTGLFASESPAQRRQDITMTNDEAFQIAMDWSRWKVNGQLLRTIINNSGKAIQYLEDNGIFAEVSIPIYNYMSTRCFHLCMKGDWKWQQEGDYWTMGGQADVLGMLRKNYESRGGKYLFKTKVTKILTGAKGAVTGVVAVQEGKEIKVNAKSVIIATGGYGANKELMKKYHADYTPDVAYSGSPISNGNGIALAVAAGAAEDLGSFIFSHHGYKYEGTMHAGMALAMGALSHIGRTPQSIWVNKNGDRFCPEWLPDHATVVYAQPGHFLYSLFDEKFKQRFLAGKHYSFMTGINGEPAPKGLEDELQAENAKGKGVKIANSWEEIGKWMGLPAGYLEATVKEYNDACDKGYDPLFNKKKAYLEAMRTPPFYAVKCYQDQHNAVGTIKINHRLEVLNTDFKAIPGFYACGDCCGGWSTDYCIPLAGMWDAFAFISGRLAGEHAAKR